MLVYIDTTN